MKGNKKKNGGGFIKRFVGNKNTVTLLGILACVATLIIGYNYRVKVSINPISVPYAKVAIPTRTLITDQMVGKIKISKTYTKNAGNLVLSESSVVKKYASYKTSIPKNSLFYKEQLVEAEDMPDHAFANIEDGYTVYSLGVDKESTYYNSIRAGDYIDLYATAKIREADGSEKIISAPFIESIKVLAVKDSKGNNILKNRMENGKPSEILFAVPTDRYEKLMLTQYVENSLEIVPVIRNDKYTTNPEETKEIEELITYITDKRVDFN